MAMIDSLLPFLIPIRQEKAVWVVLTPDKGER